MSKFKIVMSKDWLNLIEGSRVYDCLTDTSFVVSIYALEDSVSIRGVDTGKSSFLVKEGDVVVKKQELLNALESKTEFKAPPGLTSLSFLVTPNGALKITSSSFLEYKKD